MCSLCLEIFAWFYKSLHDLGKEKWRNAVSYFSLSSPLDLMVEMPPQVIESVRASPAHSLLCLLVSTAGAHSFFCRKKKTRRMQRCHCAKPLLTLTVSYLSLSTVQQVLPLRDHHFCSVLRLNGPMCWDYYHLYAIMYCLISHPPPKSSEMEIIREVNFPGLGSRPLCHIKFLLWTDMGWPTCVPEINRRYLTPLKGWLVSPEGSIF